LVGVALEGGGVEVEHAIDFAQGEGAAGFASEGVDEETTAHADAAVDAPDGEGHAGFLKSVAPGEDVLIDAVDEGAVEIEEEGGGHD
jgi:hypothetical protein